MVPEVYNEILGLANIQCKAVVLALSHQLGYLISVLCFVRVAYQAVNSGVVYELDDPVAAMYG